MEHFEPKDIMVLSRYMFMVMRNILCLAALTTQPPGLKPVDMILHLRRGGGDS